MNFELFTDIFTYKENRFTQLEPRVKILTAGLAVCLVLFSNGPLFPASMFAVSLSATIAAGVPARLAMLRITGPLGVAAMILLIKSVLTGSTELFSIDLLSLHLVFTNEGFSEGINIAFRILGALGVVQFLSVTTPAHDIFRALRWLGFPHGWVEVAMLMYRYTFELFETAIDMSSAQKTRLGYSNAKRGLASAGELAGAVILRSMDKAVSANEAMVARGYKGVIQFDPPRPVERRDLAYGFMASTLILSLYFITGMA
ncbi:MAG TPA: cobalt ECF transporter T component CbiQ [Nitrospirae bacterium]|nr:cobalt ECF transporter T component CbiQ [Nitrospirota bacterium]